MKILNFGSLNLDYIYKVDHFPLPGETTTAQSMHVDFGGKGLNQSVALAHAGMKVFHAGAVGADGVDILPYLNKSGVQTEHIKVLEKSCTGQAIIQVNGEGQNCIILHPGANAQITREHIEWTFKNFGAQDMLLIQNEINSLDFIVECALKKGMCIAFNPAPMTDKIKDLPLDKIHIVFVNEVEGLGLTGHSDPQKILSQLTDTYPHTKFVLTLGAEGAYYGDRELTLFEKAQKVKVADTTCAGDTFIGYFLAGWERYKNPAKALKMASHASSRTVMRKGTSNTIPYLKEIIELSNEL